jgi:hypothetical protein
MPSGAEAGGGVWFGTVGAKAEAGWAAVACPTEVAGLGAFDRVV